ncbi:DUF547 domain-containing protein [Pseudomarimonas arenosa]|uniref:DUF547 domain-containing protein n=1 Tax=Pseudomarimonas arenosa TaxID=2774145 RepID=A0AAW3ZHJ8_9GAMM|nr:DUF547 domain-containing protein [Pseudomarimonas arenosa]MBD8524462.1 DUF547 domain-containing protein [Pseudomarimonas arenosa]
MSRCLLSCLGLVGILGWSSVTAASGFEHEQWNDLLERHVQWTDGGHASVVDYGGMRADRARLQAYLDRLSAFPAEHFARLDRLDQLAFLLNAYNAFTVALVADGGPQIESIKDLGSLFRSPWKQRFFDLLGERRHLDEVEHELIRGNPGLADPRIHFAVNCASVGCPALRPEAYEGAKLEAQLDDQTRRFLADRSRNRVDGDTLWLSPIFRWYRQDFGDDDPPWPFLREHAATLADEPAGRAVVRAGQLDIEYTDYDWSLNAASR